MLAFFIRMQNMNEPFEDRTAVRYSVTKHSLYKSCRVFIRLNKSIKNVKTSVYGVAIKNVKTSFYGVSYQ